MNKNFLKYISVLLFIVGVFLYLGSYFIGLLFIALSLIGFAFDMKQKEGMAVLGETLKGLGKTLVDPLKGSLLALFLGAILMLISGYNPFESYGALFYGGLVKNWHISVLNAVPLIFTGLAIALAFKGGMFNIGAEGQYYIGVMAATGLGIRLNLPPIVVIPLIYLIGGFLGGAYNFLPAYLRVKTGAHEVITTMMFAYIATTLSSMFIRFNGGDPESSSHAYITDPVLENSWLMPFKDWLPQANYRLHTGIIFAIIVALIIHVILYKSRFGFQIRAVGLNSEAARTQGIPIGRITILTLMLSGVVASFAGVTQVLGLDHKMFENLNAGYGWNGIAVALLAGCSPIGVIFSALLWGILDAGGQYMARTVQTPNSIVEIIKGMVLFFILAKPFVNTKIRFWKKGGQS